MDARVNLNIGARGGIIQTALVLFVSYGLRVAGLDQSVLHDAG